MRPLQRPDLPCAIDDWADIATSIGHLKVLGWFEPIRDALTRWLADEPRTVPSLILIQAYAPMRNAQKPLWRYAISKARANTLNARRACEILRTDQNEAAALQEARLAQRRSDLRFLLERIAVLSPAD